MGRPITKTVEERFWLKVQKTESCWLWVGAKDEKGYGTFKVATNNKKMAHRLSYIFCFKTIKKGMEVCHACDNPSCVRPNHLFLGTHKENMRDMVLKGRSADRHGEKHPNSRLKNEDVLKIRGLYEKKRGALVSLGKMFGVSPSMVGKIINGKNWTHIK